MSFLLCERLAAAYGLDVKKLFHLSPVYIQESCAFYGLFYLKHV